MSGRRPYACLVVCIYKQCFVCVRLLSTTVYCPVCNFCPAVFRRISRLSMTLRATSRLSGINTWFLPRHTVALKSWFLCPHVHYFELFQDDLVFAFYVNLLYSACSSATDYLFCYIDILFCYVLGIIWFTEYMSYCNYFKLEMS